MRSIRALALCAVTLSIAACEKKQPPQAPPAAGAASGAAVGDVIVIGHVASLTGNEATFGDSTDKGIQLAVEDVNARGGVQGRRVRLLTLDNQGKPEESVTVATRLAVDEKASVLLGEVASSRSIAMAAVADERGVPMISPSSTNPAVTKENGKVRPYVFRVCFIDPFQGTVMAKFARETLKLSKVAVLRDVKNAYSVGLSDIFLAKFKELGGTIVDDQSYKAGDQDFKAQLTAIKGKKPEGIYVPGYYTDVALIARQARELGLRQPLMGGDGWDSAKLFEIGGKAMDGCYYSNHYSPDDPSPRIQQFVARFKAKFGAVPDSLAAQGYDAAQVAIDAMSRAPSLTGAGIRDAIAATKDFPGVTGVITIDADHNAVKPAVVLAIQGGAAKWVATVQPDAKAVEPVSAPVPASK